MAKRDGFNMKMPPNAKRITNNEGIRVWKFGGKEFASKRDYFIAMNPVIALPEPEKEIQNDKEN